MPRPPSPSTPSSDAPWLHPVAEGAVLSVHVVPGAARSAAVGVYGAALRVRVRARPVEGAANRELIQVLARLLGLRPAAVSVDAGARGRDKLVRVRGLAAAAVRERIEAAMRVDTARGHG